MRGTQVQRGGMNKYLSIITLNVNGLNDPIKRHRIVEWIRKHGPHVYFLQDTQLRTKNLHKLQVIGWKKYSKKWERKKKAGVAILISDKMDFKTSHKKRHRRTVHNTEGKNP